MTGVDGFPDLVPPSSSTALPWCKCGVYLMMPQEIDCDDNSTHFFMKAAYWQNVLDSLWLSGENKPEDVPFLCSNSYPVGISLTPGFIWDSMLIKPKQMQVTITFPCMLSNVMSSCYVTTSCFNL